MLEVRVCGAVEVEVDGQVLPETLLGGRQGRLVLAYLACAHGRAVRREELADLLWPDQLPETWTASLSAVISRLRRLFTDAGLDGQAIVVSTAGAYQLQLPEGSRIDRDTLIADVDEAEAAVAAGNTERALAAGARADAAAALGFGADDCEWVDARREEIRDLRVRALLAMAAAHLDAGATARSIDAARRALDLDDCREAAYRQLMIALASAGERGEALRVWERCRVALVEELGIDPSPETEAVYLRLLDATPAPVTNHLPSGVVTFLLTDIVESSALWEEQPIAMAAALERHDAIVGEVVVAHGGMLLKSKLEGDATVSVFARATEGAAAALALVDALNAEPWPEGAAPRVRMAIHTGEAFERGGDYFGPALNRAARLRALAAANEVLLSQAAAELVRDHLPEAVTLRDRGLQTLRGLSRGENIFELVRAGGPVAQERAAVVEELDRPPVPAALTGTGPFVGRGDELAQLIGLWERAAAGDALAAFVGGEPGVGKSRLAGELAQHTYAAGGLVVYGRCDEDLAAPLQPFIEAARVLAPALGATRLRAVRGADELTRVLPELTELLGEKPGVRADPDTERLALFDAVTSLLASASRDVPVLLVLDDLHWAGKTTLSLLRHVLRGAKDSRLLVVGTYRDTELARTHPLAETLADLRRDTNTHRVSLSGLAAEDVAAYLTAIGNTDRALGRELAEVTAGNPFFLIEVVRHVEESGGVWQPGTLPEGVREATGRRLSRLSDAANEALAVAAVVGPTFELSLVEQVRGAELIEPIAEALQAGLVIEEPGSLARFRFAHAIVRQVLLSELVSLKRVRLHRTIAELLEASSATAGDDARLADLAYHWFECASTGSADKAVAACRTAADRAFERLAYEEAADLYGMALQALDWIDGADAELGAALHLARCDALLTAGDVAGARDAIDALELASAGSERLAAWYTTYEGQLAVLGEPDRLTEIVQSIAAAAGAMRDLGDTRGEAKARYVHAIALERLGQFGAAERALDGALAAAREVGDRRLADAILAEAPNAALWGPSPVTRASGRCLDVVRVLRITSGTAAVEAVALRCQAVLEAMRGRMPAARRMVASSRRTVEQLGLTHRLLEADVAAGLIEMFDGKLAEAEPLLRSAYEGLRERGLDGDAARAGSYLARTLLLQGRVEEADDVAADAEALAGSDLEAAINWREVRAEAATRRGDVDRALALAREAVDLATSTDSLILLADARLVLSRVLRAAGEIAAADAETRRAIEASDEKGATVMAATARATLSSPEPAARPERVAPAASHAPTPNRAVAAMVQFTEAFNGGDIAAAEATAAKSRRIDDRRPLIRTTRTGPQLYTYDLIFQRGGRFDLPETVATRGDRVAMIRWMLRNDGAEVPFLGVTSVDETGRTDVFIMFEPEAVDEAMVALDDLAATVASENYAVRYARRFCDAFNARSWDAMAGCLAEGVTQEDRRSISRLTMSREELLDGTRLMFEGSGQLEYEVVATRGSTLALARWFMSIPEFEARDWVFMLIEANEQSQQIRSIVLDSEDLPAAMAELERFDRERLARTWSENDATRLERRIDAAQKAGDWDAALACVSDTVVCDDRRSIAKFVLDREAFVATIRFVYEGGGTVDGEVLATRGQTLALFRWTLTVPDPEAIETVLAIFLVGANGKQERVTLFGSDDLDAAYEELERQYCEHGHEAWVPNNATLFAEMNAPAFNRRDWDAMTALMSDDITLEDRRSFWQVTMDREMALANIRHLFAGTGTLEMPVVATRGESLALVRLILTVAQPEARDWSFMIIEANDQGVQKYGVVLEPNDIHAALAELDRLYAERALEAETGGSSPAVDAILQFCEAYNRGGMELAAAVASARPRIDDRRPIIGMTGYGFEMFPHDVDWGGRVVFDPPEVLETRGDRVVLSRWNVRNDEIEMPFLSLVHVDSEGLIDECVMFEPEAIAEARTELERFDRELERAGEAWAENDATRHIARTAEAFNMHDWDAVVRVTGRMVLDDRRGWVQSVSDAETSLASTRLVFEGRGHFDFEILASRGRTLALVRWTLTIPEPEARETVLCVVLDDEAGQQFRAVQFDVDDLDAAYAELERLYVEVEGAPAGNAAWWTAQRLNDALLRRDLKAAFGLLDPEFAYVDSRNQIHSTGDDARQGYRMLVALDQFNVHQSLIETRGDRVVLVRAVTTFTDGMAGPAEYSGFSICEVNDQGLMTRVTLGLPDDLDAARALLERRAAAVQDDTGNRAWRCIQGLVQALNDRNWDSFLTYIHPDIEIIDQRYRTRFRGDDALEVYRIALAMDGIRIEQQLIAIRGDHLGLARAVTTMHDGATGPAENVTLTLFEIDDAGLQCRVVFFGDDDEEAALAALDSRFVELIGGNAAWRAALRHRVLIRQRDWDAFVSTLHPDFEVVDHHSTLRGDAALEIFRVGFSVDELSTELTLLATRGDHIALIKTDTTLRDGLTGSAEVSMFVLNEVDDQGRFTRVTFNLPEDHAYEALEARFAELEAAAPDSNRAWELHLELVDAAKRKDRDAYDQRLHPDFQFHDYRSGIAGRYDEDKGISMLALFDMDVVSWESQLIATAGDRLALYRTNLRATSHQVGEAAWDAYTLDEIDADGRLVRVCGFNADALEQAMAVFRARAEELEHDPLAIPRNRAVLAVEEDGWSLIAALEEDLCMHATPDGFVLHEVDEDGNVVAKIEYGPDDRRAATDEFANRFYAHHNQLVGTSMSAAMNAGDLNGALAAFSESVVFEDHRRLRMFDQATGAEYVAMLEPVFEVAPDLLTEILRSYAVLPWGQALLCRMSGTTAAGGAFENACIGVNLMDANAQITHVALYEPDDVEGALARLREHGPDSA